MASDEQAREKARMLLKQIAGKRRTELEDDRLRALLTDDLVELIFDTAWQHQWESDFTGFKREIRPAVEAAVSEAVQADAD